MKKRNNILILTYWSYKDALVQAYTLPYVRIIRKTVSPDSRIFLATFDQPNQLLSPQEKQSAIEANKAEGIELKLFRYLSFNLLAPFRLISVVFKLWYLIIFEKIDTIHAWCMPAGSLGFVLSKLTGRRLVIDSYEPQAEAMIENGTWTKESLKYKIQFYFERKLSQHAKIIISATAGMREYAQKKYKTIFEKFYVKPACVDLTTFNFSLKKNQKLLDETGLTGKIVGVYAGKFGGIYLTEEVFELFAASERMWGDKFRALLLTNHKEDQLRAWSTEAGFSYEKIIRKFVPHSEIAAYIGLGDFAITPVKSIPTKRYCTPIKDGEYWAMGLPVIITKDISDDSNIISTNDIGYVLTELNPSEFQKCILKIDELIHKESTGITIRAVAEKYRSYAIASQIYREIYG